MTIRKPHVLTAADGTDDEQLPSSIPDDSELEHCIEAQRLEDRSLLLERRSELS